MNLDHVDTENPEQLEMLTLTLLAFANENCRNRPLVNKCRKAIKLALSLMEELENK